MSVVNLAVAVYTVGVAIGLLLTDARPIARVMLALLWPIGPLAFVVTVSLLLVASMIAFPVFGVTVLAAIGVAGWMFF